MESFTRLRQTINVVVYKGQFEALSNRIKGLSDSHKLSCFLSGLKDEVSLPVKMLHPKNLNKAFGLVKSKRSTLIVIAGVKDLQLIMLNLQFWVPSLRGRWNPN